MPTYEEKCAAVERENAKRKAVCDEINRRHEEKKNAWRKELDSKPVKLRSTKKQLKEMGFKIITQ